MKKFGFLIFAATLITGVVVANMSTFGRTSAKIFNFSFKSGVKGSGNAVKEARSLGEFEAVDVGSAFRVDVTTRKDFAVEVEADDNILGLIRTEVRDGVLYIETESKVSPSTPMKVTISCPNLKKVEASGVAKVDVSSLNAREFEVSASGASEVKVSGEATKLTADASGASKVYADDLKAVDANVEASGASSINVNVSGDLRGEANGASKIFYGGSPANVYKSSNGASRISPK